MLQKLLHNGCHLKRCLRETLREIYGTLTGPECPADLPSFALGELTGNLREPLWELTEPEWPDDLPFSILEHSPGFVSFCNEFQCKLKL